MMIGVAQVIGMKPTLRSFFSIAGTAKGMALAPSPSEIAIGIGASMCEASYSLLMVLSRITAQPAVFTTSTLRPCFE